jgi:hypothetical protein
MTINAINATQETSEIKEVIEERLSYAKGLVVEDEEGYKKITLLYRQARQWKDALEAKRKDLVEPLRKQTAAINYRAKELSKFLDAIIDIANIKAGKYQQLLVEIKRKEEEALREAAKLFEGEEELYIPPMDKTIRGDGAYTITKQEKRFRVKDISKVPMKYLMVNEDAVKIDIKLGIAEIPGIEIYEETITQLRRR